MRRWCFFLLGLVWWGMLAAFGGASPVHADENFTTKLHTIYTVGESGQATIEHRLQILNKTPALYVKQYALKISSQQALANIRVFDNGQAITPNVVQGDRFTSIGITFPDKVVGQNQGHELVISFQSPDFSTQTGQVLEVNVPSLAEETFYDQYDVTLITPQKYGAPVRVSPSASSSQVDGSAITTHFSNLGRQGVSALFGQQQVFQFTLRYHLHNPTDRVGITQVALPPDTSYQKLQYTSIEPLPQDIATDVDGNWIATYQLNPNQNLTVHAIGQALVTLEPNPFFPVQTPADELTKSAAFWEADGQVGALASQYPTPRAIFDYVVSTLQYPSNIPDTVLPRLGANATLAEPTQATCQEFTDLFIAMARANHIPARRLTGYAYTQNNSLRPLSLINDILHAWPEYYDSDQQQWIQVDPTWTNTTGGVNYFDQFDLNHLVFAINGNNSSTPYPAGSYKDDGSDGKDVEVSFGETFTPTPPQIAATLVPHQWLGITIPGWYTLDLTNATGQAWYDSTVDEVQVTGPAELAIRQTEIATLLPFETQHIPVRIRHQTWNVLVPTKLSFSVELHGAGGEYTIPVTIDTYAGHFFFGHLFDTTSVVGLGIGSSLLALIAGSVLVLRRRSSRPVRRQS